ncbi:uncharacterized protein G2W53_044218 [Senna tora]|uniref:Uncharacterized protein n=1 Tax=Senna tora TaxID=362788 RepID=A0A834SK31_9FABA|nr:uncharacterized protein G2W53_044218 [Senna tora]
MPLRDKNEPPPAWTYQFTNVPSLTRRWRPHGILLEITRQ